MRKILITGSSGLIGSEVCTYFAARDWQIHGVDNNQREVFFGPDGSTRSIQKRLIQTIENFKHYELDVRNRVDILELLQAVKPDAIVHTAAQPSHDKASTIPYDDFDTNAVGTFNLLEATRRYSVAIPFIHLSTNKVYGDGPNSVKMSELETRYEFTEEKYVNGIAEDFGIDQTKHSLFGASKVSADISVQEYGRYFNMPTVCLRGGCLTGPNHAGVELHGFLSYLIKCNLEEKEYSIFGYKGKQVRDIIHAFDVASFIEHFIEDPRRGEVYNIGGGRTNTCSILEAFDIIGQISKTQMRYQYHDANRPGDHICYYSDLRKINSHYPQWEITKPLDIIFEEIYQSWKNKLPNRNFRFV